mgnify:CR=1 FL=1
MKYDHLLAALCLLTGISTSLLSQTLTPVFDAPRVILDASRPPITLLGDFDGDGDVDGFAAWYQGSTASHQAIENNGSGTLTPVGNILTTTLAGLVLPVPAAPRPRAADINGDGLPDIVAGFGSRVWVYRTGHPLSINSQLSINLTASVVDLEVGDFNGDQLPDLAVLTTVGLEVWFHTGTLGIYPATSDFFAAAPGSSGDRLLRMDVNRDGRPDLIVASSLAVGWICFAQTGISQGIMLHDVNPVMPAVGDVNQDGHDDVVLFGTTTYRLLRNVAANQFVLEAPLSGGPATDLADMNGDGFPDGICCSSGGGGTPVGPNTLNSKFEIAINNGGLFAPSFQLQGLGARHVAGAADINGDGTQDLVGGRCAIFQRDSYPLGAAGSWSIPIPGGFQPAKAVDIQGDGAPDLAFSNAEIHRNRGDGAISVRMPQIPTPPVNSTFGSHMVFGDFDGDGDGDILIEHFSTLTQTNNFLSLRLLRNVGNDQYEDAGPATPPGFGFVPMGSTLASSPETMILDCDADGDLDILIQPLLPTGAPQEPTRLWLNDGTGFFSGANLPSFATRIHAANDLNGDGLPELIGAQILDNLGGGLFGAPRPILQSGTFQLVSIPITDPLQIAVFDADRDGWPDILAVEQSALGSSTSGNQLWFLKNLGGAQAGTFLRQAQISTDLGTSYGNLLLNSGYDARYVHAVDFDGDGFQDLVAGPVAQTNLKGSLVIRNTGPDPSQWTPLEVLMMRPTTMMDMDGDGDLDAVGMQSGMGGLWTNGLRSGVTAGARVQFGSSNAGRDGISPLLGTPGPLVANASTALIIRAGLGGAAGLLAVGTQEAATPLPGGALLVASPQFLPFVLGGTPGSAGEGTWTLPLIFANPSLVGLDVYLQAGIADPWAIGGVSLTQGLRLRVAP